MSLLFYLGECTYQGNLKLSGSPEVLGFPATNSSKRVCSKRTRTVRVGLPRLRRPAFQAIAWTESLSVVYPILLFPQVSQEPEALPTGLVTSGMLPSSNVWIKQIPCPTDRMKPSERRWAKYSEDLSNGMLSLRYHIF